MAQFKSAFGKLGRDDSFIAKDVIMQRCRWSPQLWSAKMNGKRPLKEFSSVGVNEVQVVKSTFQSFGIDAFTGDNMV